MDLKYEKYIVAHIDILGCKNILHDKESSEVLLNKLKKIYSDAPKAINELNESVRKEFDKIKDGFECSDFNIETKIFSDNICIYLKYPNSKEKYFIYVAWFLQIIAYYQYYSISEYGLLLRGAINIGNFYGDDKFVIGPALSVSYEKESNEAIAPRILICEDLKEDFLVKGKRKDLPFTRKDFDKNLFIDYLIYTQRPGKNQKELLFKHRDILIEYFKKAKEYKNKVKILLAMNYHNRYCNNVNEWDTTSRTGVHLARLSKLEECSIDITKFLAECSS